MFPIAPSTLMTMMAIKAARVWACWEADNVMVKFASWCEPERLLFAGEVWFIAMRGLWCNFKFTGDVSNLLQLQTASFNDYTKWMEIDLADKFRTRTNLELSDQD